MLSWIHQSLPLRKHFPHRSRSGRLWPRRLGIALGWCLALLVQAVLILLVREVIQLAHGVISLYLDLASLQLDLQSTYIASTTPK